MVDIKLLYRGETGKGYQYFVNPHIFFKGQKINDTLKAMFKDYDTLKNEEGWKPRKKRSNRRKEEH